MAAVLEDLDHDTCFLPLGLAGEFEGLDLGDKRTNQNALRFAHAHAVQPDKPYPQVATSEAELQAFYHLLSEADLEPPQILAPHFAKTVERCSRCPTVLVLHDTSAMKFDVKADRSCLGFLDSNQRGFLFHPSLAVDPATFCPLGLVAFKTWSRPRPVRKTKKPSSGSEHAKGSFTSKEGLERALAFSAPVAWYLLVLRNAEQVRPQNPAREILSEQQILLLRQISTRVKLKAEPTVCEAVRAIAGLGGFVSWNKRAGWRVLERGLEALIQAEWGWAAAVAFLRSGSGNPKM